MRRRRIRLHLKAARVRIKYAHVRLCRIGKQILFANSTKTFITIKGLGNYYENVYRN